MTGPTPHSAPTPQLVGDCTGRTDIDWFASDRRDRAAAITICQTCPTRPDCYTVAVARNETCGVWGGVDFGHPRRVLGLPRVAAKCGTDSGYKSHRDRGETACAECRAAHVRYNAERNRRRRWLPV